jgi:hypothetical protein
MAKGFAGVPLESWESALRRHVLRGRGRECCTPVSECDWGAVAATAFRLSGASVPFGSTPEEWAEDILPGELFEAAELATVGFGFPNSQHGDAIWVTVSAFPGGTVLGTRRDSSFGNDSLVFFFRKPSVAKLDSAARSAADEALDGGDFVIYDQDDKGPEDHESAAVRFGFKRLRAAWGRRLRSLQRRAVFTTAAAGRPRRAGGSGARKRPSKRNVPATWTPGEIEQALCGIEEWTPETFRMLQQLHGKAASEKRSRSGNQKKSRRGDGAWSAVERRLFGNPNRHLRANRKYGRGFGASLMDGPYVSLFDIAGLRSGGELSDRLWDNHNWESLLDECDEIVLIKTGEDNVPRMSDAYYWVAVDHPDRFARQLRDAIIRIALKTRVP